MRLIATALLLACSMGLGATARAADDIPAVPKEWLDKKISIAEAEKMFPGVNDERVRSMPEIAKPFGFLNARWEDLKAQMQPGDELWTFHSPSQTWQDLAGSGGVVVVRDGVPIQALVTVMN
jgi:hypothetical protein